MTDTIYLIKKDFLGFDEICMTDVIGWVETEEEAKHAIEELNKNVPYNPISDHDLSLFKEAMFLWECKAEALCNSGLPEYINEYYDETQTPRITDQVKWNKRNEEIFDLLIKKEIEFFQSDETPIKVSPEDILMYHKWDDYHQAADDYMYYYEPCKKF